MKKIAVSILFAVLPLSAPAAEPYVGTFLYKYKGGPTYRVTVPDEKVLKWECIEGDEKGASGEEKPTRFKVADGVYFATWVEKSGVIVSQAVNLKELKVYSTIVAEGKRYVLEGEIVKE